MAVSFDPNLLLGYFQSHTGVAGAQSLASSAAKRKVAPTPPWTSQPKPTQVSDAVKAALVGRRLIDENAAQLDLAGASSDYRKLFALYQGMSTLSSVAEHINTKSLTALEKSRVQSTFAKGMAEVSAYVSGLDLDLVRLTKGEATDKARAKLGVPKTKTDYITGPLVSGSSASVVDAFQGAVQFTMSVKRLNTTTNVAIDLADMGAQPRTLANVINHINSELQSAGVATRVATQRIPAAPRTFESGGKTITLPPGQDQWALKLKIDSLETLSFTAAATAPAVYIAQTIGDPDPDKKADTDDGVTKRQLVKFQTDTSVVPGPLQTPGEANWVDGRAFAETLGPEVKTIRAQQVGPDGAVYMLADVTAKTAGQDIKGTQDVALLKYDTAGNLVYSRTLGAAQEASGLALAVAADGQVAIAGSVKGVLGGAVDGALNSGTTGAYAGAADSYVTLFDAEGQELWTQRRGARQEDEATSLAFGAAGEVYVAGRAKSSMPGATAIGNWDSYIEAFKEDAQGKVQTLFTQSFGTTGTDKPAGMVVDGTSLVVAGAENGRGVLRRFDISGAAPALTATRDLGDLEGGDIVGLALDGAEVVVAGTTRNAALAGGTITRAHAGGSDAFAARLSATLTAGGGDLLAYYGGAGDDKAAGLAVSAGTAWITGQVGTTLPGHVALGTKDGFVAGLDVAAGSVAWSRRFTGKDGYATPTAIAVDAAGASVLDRIGLPKGTIDLSDSTHLTAISALRAGDQFTVRGGQGRTTTITMAADETLDTLAAKLTRALGFQAKIEIKTLDGLRQISIAPLSARHLIEIGAGKTNADALAMLGLPEGVVRMTTMVDGKTMPADGKAKIYGLSLPHDLDLSSDEQVRHAVAELAQAMGVIRTAYKDLVAVASPPAPPAITGKVPAYLTNQIANYQAALQRLGG